MNTVISWCSYPTPAFLYRIFWVTLMAVVMLGCANRPGSSADSTTLSAQDRQSLLLAVSLLEDTLGGEAELKWLLLVKKLTLQGPGKEVEQIMVRIQRASEKRKSELQSLRKLDPPIMGEPPPSPMGDAIQSAAEEAGTEEMIFSKGVFNIRFLFLQAQATRMISVVAAQAAWVDPNRL